MRFKNGNQFGKGRPKGSSKKTIAMNAIFEIMDKHKEQFIDALDFEAHTNILEFYSKYVVPVQPKNLDIDDESEKTNPILVSFVDDKEFKNAISKKQTV